MYLQEAHLLALGVQIIDDLLGAAAHRAHSNNNTLGIRRAVIIKEVIFPACQRLIWAM